MAQLVLDLVEFRRRRVAGLLDLDHMPAELRLDRLLGVLSRLQREGSLLEGRHHLPLAEEAEVAAIRPGRARRLLLGDGLEISAALEFLDDRFGLLLGLQEDVPRMHLLARWHRGDLLVVARLELVLGDVRNAILGEIGVVQRAVALEL